MLELGCGWGSLCLYVAAKYPKSRVTAVSNSSTQREFITKTAASRGIANLTVVTANLVDFQPPKSRLTGSSTYDRVVTIECFEPHETLPGEQDVTRVPCHAACG